MSRGPSVESSSGARPRFTSPRLCSPIPLLRIFGYDRTMMRIFACWGAAMLVAGCRNAEAPSQDAQLDSANEARSEGSQMPIETPALEWRDQERAPAENLAVVEDPVAPSAADIAAAAESPAAAANAQQDESTQRDLAAELNAALGIPDDCLQDFQAAGPRTIQVQVSATVRPSGVIISPSASGVGLSSRERQCIAARVGAISLRPLDEDVSRRVSTEIAIAYRPPAVAVPSSGVPEPQLRNVRDPLPQGPDIAPSGRPIEDRAGRPIPEPNARPIQDRSSRDTRSRKPRAIDGHEIDDGAEEWR